MNILFENDINILDKLPVGIVITTHEGKILECNTMILKMFGYDSKEEFLKLTAHDLYYNSDDRKKVYKNMYIDNSGSTELFVKRKDNSIFWARTTYIAHESAKEGTYCLSVVEDLTAHKQAEEDLYLLYAIIKGIAESNDFHSAIEITLKRVCESTGWACGEVWIPSKDETCLEHGNTWYCNIEGMKEFEDESDKYRFPRGVGLPGLVWSSKKPEWMDDITLDDNFPRRHLAIKAGLESAMGIPILANDEVIAVMVFLTSEIKKEDERMISLISTIASQLGILFQKKQMESFLRESETVLKNIIESVPVGIAVATPEGKPIGANTAILKMLGYESKEEILSIPIIKHYYKPDDRERLIRILQEKGIVRDFEVQLIRKDGSVFWCDINAVMQEIKNEKRIIVSFDDITENKRHEEYIRHKQKLEAVGQLTGGIAHDFNNILTGIMLSSEFLKLKIDKNHRLRANVEQISELSLKASNLIQGLLAFSRKQTINLQYVNLKDIIASIKKLLSRVIREDIKLNINISGKDLIILGDEVQIEQVIINLAINARDAMPNGGVLTIEVTDTEIDDNFINTHRFGKAGRYALITVTDTGIGIDENIQKKIFEPFFTTKEVGKGTGLGLAMVYGLTKQHEGYIDLYSKPGKGTTFKIYLPIKELKVEDVKPKEEVIPKRGSETVLVAEDNEPTRSIIINILESYGYKVIEAIDGDDAIKKFIENKDRIKLVILDVIMPKKSGKEAYDTIANILPKIKVLLMSGYTGDTLQVKEIAEKGLNFISKPFTQIDLLKKVRYTLDS